MIRKYLLIVIAIFLMLGLFGCSTNQESTSSVQPQVISDQLITESVSESQEYVIVDTEEIMGETHEDAGDYTWDDTTQVAITLNGESATAESDNVRVNGSQVSITAAGTYNISGQLSDGQVVVDTADEETVRLILNGVSISSSTSAALYIKNAEKVVIVLEDGTQNVLTDAETYIYSDEEENEPNAAMFSTSDLTLTGSGALTVNGNFNDGIVSKDGLIIDNGEILVSAVDDGIRGKDYIVVKTGAINVVAGGDGLKSDNDEDVSLGYISVLDGSIKIESDGDAITAQTSVTIYSGKLNLRSGGGAQAQLTEDISAKGIKGLASVTLDGGTYTINAADDAIHSNGEIYINAGTYAISTGDDGVHADASLVINSGSISITQSYEGIESAVITINDGQIHITSSDDGINVAGGLDSSGMRTGFGGGRPGEIPGDPGARQPDGTMPNGTMPEFDNLTTSGDYLLTINGGSIYVEASGDGLDINGAVIMTGGVVLVNGPTNDGNAALDYDAGFTISGGTLLAVGSAGMAMAPDNTSTQNSILVNLDDIQQAGTLIHFQDEDGNALFTFEPVKDFQSICYSSKELQTGKMYKVIIGGSASGVDQDGFYSNETYSGGEDVEEFTISSVVTQVGAVSRGGRR